MLTLGTLTGPRRDWAIPVIAVSAYKDEGIEALLDSVALHKATQARTTAGQERRCRVAEFRLHKTAQTLLLERFAKGSQAFAPQLSTSLATRVNDPYAAAQQLISLTIRKEYRHDLA